MTKNTANRLRLGFVALSAILLMNIPNFAAFSQPPSFVDSITCGINEGWENSPTVNIDSTGAPTASGTSAVILVRDAISDYWNDDATVDSEDENGAGSSFGTIDFGIVTVDDIPADINISFATLDPGVLGQASCIIDSSTGFIVSATVELTTDTSSLSDEDYKNISAHELGHAIGLRAHNGSPGTMMFKFFIGGLDAYNPLSKSSQRTLNNLYG